MERPTAAIRRLLILESLQQYLSQEIASLKKNMSNSGLRILGRQDNLHDIWIQYQFGTSYEESIFMKKMLDAESRNRAKRTGVVS